MYWLILQVCDCHSGIVVTIEFDKCESSIGLHSNLDNVTITLEKRDQVGLADVWDKITDVYCRVELGSLSSDDIVRQSWGWRVRCWRCLVMSHWRGGDTGRTHHVMLRWGKGML